MFRSPDSVFPYYIFLSKHLRQTIQNFFYLSVFISYCCCNKLLQTQWHKTTPHLIVLEARSPKRVSVVAVFSWKFQERLCCLLLLVSRAARMPWLVAALLQYRLPSLQHFTTYSQISLCLPFVRMLVLMFRIYLNNQNNIPIMRSLI